jgi:hypothetical protein
VERTVTLRDRVTAGIVAGVAGGTLFALFVFALELAAGMPPGTLGLNFVQVAATVLGPRVLGNQAFVPVGVLLHLWVAVGWALGYVDVVRTQPQLVTRPWVSGAAFGIVVYVFMMIILITAGQYHRPMPGVLGAQLVAHIAFYGIPVALIVARLLRTSTGAGPA